MYDAVEVAVGPRCGEFRPVLGRLEAGQRVVTAGAFLLDAEARLNPAAAAAYFGASRAAAPPAGPTPTAADADVSAALDRLLPADRIEVERQQVCPVTGERLGAMGTPVRVQVAGRTVWLCCRSCERELRRHPDKYPSGHSAP
jgi:hypothetical protein